MSIFFRIFQHLLPQARAWSVVVEKTLRNFFEGLTGLPSDFKDFIDQVWLDVFPDTTQQLEAWELQMGVIAPAADDATRRATLGAAWLKGEGMGPDTIEGELQAAGFPLFVHEAWYFDPGKKIRNPNLYLVDDDTLILYVVECGEPLAECGEPTAICGDATTPTGILLVNKILKRDVDYKTAVQCGEAEAACGELFAACGDNNGFSIAPKAYAIPLDPSTWPYFWYIGGAVFGDSVSIPTDRKEELETMILKIGPTHLWAGLLVTYS